MYEGLNQANSAYVDSPKPQREPAIHSVMAQLDKQIERLAQVVSALDGRLMPICRSEPSAAEDLVRKEEIRPALPPLLDTISGMTRRVGASISNIEQLLARLEL